VGVRVGYKQTEVGVVPENWEVDCLRRFWSITDCKHVTARFVSDGYSVASIREVQARFVDLTNAKQTTQQFYALLIEGGRGPRVGDLILSRNATVGELAQVAEWHPPFAMGQDVCLLRKTSPEFSTNYLQTVFRSPIVTKQIEDSMVGSTFKRINVQTIKKFFVPMPPAPEQKVIAEALSNADELIESLEDLLVKKRDIKQGAMQELLTGRKRLPGFSEKWRSTTVEDVILGQFCGPSPTCEERNINGEEEWGVLKTTAITWENGWDWTKHKTLPKVFWNRPQQEIAAGDVIVTKAGPRHRVGVTCWVDFCPRRILVSGKMIGIRPNTERVVPFMLAAAISAREAQEYLNQRTTGMAESQVNFENTDLLHTPIQLPQITEQAAIASILSDMDVDISALETTLTKARLLKQGMMQELLTGRIRLV
jgi:type I restriction enzyme S subunit